MTHSGQLRLADLSIAKSEDFCGTLQLGTPLYMAPEVIVRERYNRSADIFSYGLNLLKLLCGQNVSKKINSIKKLPQLPGLAFLDEGRPEKKKLWSEAVFACWSEVPANISTTLAMVGGESSDSRSVSFNSGNSLKCRYCAM